MITPKEIQDAKALIKVFRDYYTGGQVTAPPSLDGFKKICNCGRKLPTSPNARIAFIDLQNKLTKTKGLKAVSAISHHLRSYVKDVQSVYLKKNLERAKSRYNSIIRFVVTFKATDPIVEWLNSIGGNTAVKEMLERAYNERVED
jgi:hypothetical protein